jgi:hypothetical protein
MPLLVELLLIFLVVVVSNNFYIKKVVSKRELFLNIILLVTTVALLLKQSSSLQIILTVVLISTLCFFATACKEHLLVGLIFQVLAISLMTKAVEGHTLLELQGMQSMSLWREVPSWSFIFQPYAFALLFMSAVLYSHIPFIKSLIIWLLLKVFLGGSFIRGSEISFHAVFAVKALGLIGLLNVVESLGFKRIGIISKINNRPIMVLWVLNIINNVFGIFKI